MEWWEYFPSWGQNKATRSGLDFLQDMLVNLARKEIYEPGYKPENSAIPFYDDIYRYFDRIKMAEDYKKNTGKNPAYGSQGYTFGNASNLINSGIRTTRSAVYSVGNLSKRL